VGKILQDLIRLFAALGRIDTLQPAHRAGLLGPETLGLTLGYGIFIVSGHDTVRLLSHEFRHVYQYETLGSIEKFLPVYLQQIVDFGYADAPLEVDAREYEMHSA